jgi:hypothetical protein
MSKPNQSTSGDTSDTSGSEGGNKEKETQTKTYSEEFVSKMRGELDNYRKSAKELETKLKEIETKDLEKKNEYKTLYEQQLKRASDLEGQLTGIKEQTVGSKKKEALTKSLFKLGLDEKFLDDALKLTTLKNVSVDPETHAVFGADEEAKSFFEKYKGLGFFKGVKRLPTNHDAPRFNEKPITEDLSKMSQQQKLARLRELHSK